MKLSNRVDIEAPIEYVFERVSDFEQVERRARREGLSVRRSHDGPVTKGTQWHIEAEIRGRPREFTSTLVALAAPEGMRFDTVSDGLSVETTLELIPLSPYRTRAVVGFDMRARTLTVRLLLQSMKLAKSRLDERLKKRLTRYAHQIEDEFRLAE